MSAWIAHPETVDVGRLLALSGLTRCRAVRSDPKRTWIPAPRLVALVGRHLRAVRLAQPMTDPDLLVEVVDDEIIITVPGSHYSVTYYKPEKSPQLLARRISDTDDRRVAMTLSEFLARAWRLANDKARERIQVLVVEHQSAVQTVMRNGPLLGPPTKCGDRAAEPSRCHCDSEEAPWR